MDRRTFIRRGGSGLCAAGMGRLAGPLHAVEQQGRPVQMAVDEERPFGTIPRDFLGFGYEVSSVAQPGLFSARDTVYTQLVHTLAPAGVIRVGGNTSDFASYSPAGKAVSAPKATIVDRESLRQLAGFLRATGWKLIWGLNLGQGSVSEAVEEAKAVSALVENDLLAFEIGNEPDLFVNQGHRKANYSFNDYLVEYRHYKSAIRASLPHASFAGPDVAGHTDWVRQFADAEGRDLKLLTHHYYRQDQSANVSYDMLLHPDPKLQTMLDAMQRASVGAGGLPYRICETNSFSGGGKPGISGTFGAALWVLDYFFILASHDAAGVNLQTGVNHRGFVSSYSPIGDDEHGTYTAKPEYYGMLAFAQATRGGKRVPVQADAGGLNLTSYAVADGSHVVATVINKDRASAAAVDLRCKRPVHKASAMRLEAPSLESSSGVLLGGKAVSADGRWQAGTPEPVVVASGRAKIVIPPVSAALITLTL